MSGLLTDDMPGISSAWPHLCWRPPHPHISHYLLRFHMPKSNSPQVLEPWASLFGAPVSSTVPPPGHPLGLLLLPSKCPWNTPTLVNCRFLSGGPLLPCLGPGRLTREALAPTFSSSSCRAQRLECSFQRLLGA